jgi:NAD(P)-dependent dehydrogenase (short-subunit alcohol dehydrogenase family)
VLIDVTNQDQIAACVKEVHEAAPKGLDALVNNAGIAVAGPLEALPPEEFRRQIEVNLSGQVAVTQAFLPDLRQSKGRLVFISSDNGRLAVPCLSAYSASKHAVEAIADALRLELRPAGVRVVLIEPGAIDTPIWEKTREEALAMRRRYPHELEGVYGSMVDRVEATSNKQAKRAASPERVAKTVAAGLNARRPGARYVVGLDARLGLIAARWMPTALRDRLVARAAGLR